MPPFAPRRALLPADPAPASLLLAASDRGAGGSSSTSSTLKPIRSDTVDAADRIGLSVDEAEELRAFQAAVQAEQLVEQSKRR